MGDRGSAPQHPKPSAAEWIHRIRQNREAAKAREVPSKADLQQVEQRLQRRIEKVNPNRGSGGQAVTRAAKMMARGFTDISKSMSHVDAPGQRPRISQLPNPKGSPMRQSPNLDLLKSPELRGRNIQGKRTQ